jgi:signal transduction histidine kinase
MVAPTADGAMDETPLDVEGTVAQVKRGAERTRLLQSVTARLSSAMLPPEVAEAVVDEGTPALGAATGAIYLLDEAGKHLVMTRSRGYPDDSSRFSVLPLDARIPAADAVIRGEPIWLESTEAYAERYPMSEERSRDARDPAEMSIACLPLEIDHRSFGVLAFAFAEPTRFDDTERSFLLTLSRHCAQALERARLFDSERKARADAEAAHLRSTFLSEASAVLSSSLNFEETLHKVARLAVPHMADWCVVEIAEEGREGSRELAVAHVDPSKVQLAKDFQKRYPPDPLAARGVPNVIRTGMSEIYPVIAGELPIDNVRSSAYRLITEELGLKSAMIVPMSARGRTFGAITFVSAESGRQYGDADLEMAEHLGRRAGLAIDNARLYAQAQSAANLREKVLAVVSHDLRNPLSAIKLNAAKLLRAAGGGEADAVRKNAVSIQHAADRMERLISDLLDIGSIEAGKLSIRVAAHSPWQMVNAAAETFVPLAQEAHLRLQAVAPRDLPAAACDRDRVIQVLSNLISNAIKVTPQGGEIKISAEQSGTEIVFAVKDTGPGIAQNDLAHIFERFWRAKDAPYKGTGLGLAIAKGIVDALGGRIWVDSAIGQGARFFFAVPTAPEQPEAASSPRGEVIS